MHEKSSNCHGNWFISMIYAYDICCGWYMHNNNGQLGHIIATSIQTGNIKFLFGMLHNMASFIIFHPLFHNCKFGNN